MKTGKMFLMPYIVIATAIIGVGFTSCSNKGNEPTPLSESQVSKIVNSFLKDKQISPAYTHFSVGRFRCDDKDSREMYRKLQAAGVITLKIDTTEVTRKVKTGTDWWSGRPKYAEKTQTMFTLTTTLTNETQKYVLEENPSKDTADPDMKQPEIGDFPEFHLDEVVYDTPDIEEGESAYKVVYTKGTEISLYKIRNIKVNQQLKDCASFECILQNGEVTPAYRVINKTYNNEKVLLFGKLQYFIDKGWTVVNLSSEE